MRDIKGQLESERRKGGSDEGKVRQLERQLDEKGYAIRRLESQLGDKQRDLEVNNRRSSYSDERVKSLQEELEK